MKLIYGLRRNGDELLLDRVGNDETWTVSGDWVVVCGGLSGTTRRATRIVSDVKEVVARAFDSSET